MSAEPADHSADIDLVGAALFGADWRTDALARTLGVSSRRVRYWRAGQEPVPPGVWAELAEMLRLRQPLLRQALAAALRGAADRPDEPAPPNPPRAD